MVVGDWEKNTHVRNPSKLQVVKNTKIFKDNKLLFLKEKSKYKKKKERTSPTINMCTAYAWNEQLKVDKTNMWSFITF